MILGAHAALKPKKERFPIRRKIPGSARVLACSFFGTPAENPAGK
jgi:hypothetical protein